MDCDILSQQKSGFMVDNFMDIPKQRPHRFPECMAGEVLSQDKFGVD